jgi:CRP-like cAMP-binding protein
MHFTFSDIRLIFTLKDIGIMEKKDSGFVCEPLSRGGLLVSLGDFLLQIGSYPETIKDTMKTEKGVPDLILLPDDLFDINFGLSIAEIEFPVYYNFFIKKRKTRIICKEAQKETMLRVITQSIFGPEKIGIEGEYADISKAHGIPDLKKEMDYYRLNPTVDGGYLRIEHVVDILTFDKRNKITADGVTITASGVNTFIFEKSGARDTVVFQPLAAPPVPVSSGDEASPSGGFYEPPLFGITVIGSGHGFDANARTAGFIIWIDGKGILVDPPVHTTIWLRQNRINTRLIEDIILTHCHADHDGGTLQKILEETQIRIHTTETILGNFLDKYSGLVGLANDELRALFLFEPVFIDLPVSILGARFKFKYSFHSIPTIGFNASFQGQSFVYSSDTLNDPEIIESVRENGIISYERKDDLLNFPWDGTVIFHEAGIPPIHTPIATLAGLPEKVKEHLYLVHISDESVPVEGSLKKAKPGLAHTIVIDVQKPETSMAARMLDAMSRVDLFRKMSVEKSLEFISIALYREYKPGEYLIHQGSEGDSFFIVLTGEVEIVMEGLPAKLIYSNYDFIGDTAIILNQPRNADAIARTRVEVLCLLRPDFLHFIRNTSIADECRRIAYNREKGARWLFEKNPIAKTMTSQQKNELLGIMKRTDFAKGTQLAAKKGIAADYFWIDSGSAAIAGDRKAQGARKAKEGDLLGTFAIYDEVSIFSADVIAETDISAYTIAARDMKDFLLNNPGICLRLLKLNRRGFI